jgi:hypothetical protein
MIEIEKYPRTQHIEGSRLQAGDEDLAQVPLASLRGEHLMVEEKVDGANAGIRFTSDGRMWLQSRGHYLSGGDLEQFDLFKSWAETHRWWLHEILGHRYIVYGEWMHKKHTVFYDRLPALFMEFDVLDTETGNFFSTEMRRMMFDGVPMVSVPVLYEGPIRDAAHLKSFVRPSLYKGPTWKATLESLGTERGLDLERLWRQTDPSDLSEGLYIKHEVNGVVRGRYKWVRHDFHQKIKEQNEEARGHVAFTPFLPNQLATGVDIFGGRAA